MIRAIIFDFDGVIVESVDIKTKAFARLFEHEGKVVVEKVVDYHLKNGGVSRFDKFRVYQCFVATATPQEEIAEIIKQREMTAYFKGVSGAPKKKDVIVREILDGYSLKPQEVIYVGDAMSDYHAACENSVRFIARIHDNESIFKGIECTKIMDLTDLGRIINENADTGQTPGHFSTSSLR